MKLLVDQKTGLTYRDDTYDLSIIKEMSSYAPLRIRKGMSVLDVGGNIGAFANWAVICGAELVRSFEPDPDNFKLLYGNTDSMLEVGIWEAAIIDSPTMKKIKLYINEKGVNKALHSVVPTRGRPYVEVDVISVDEMIALYGHYDVLKVDIEGGEYNWNWDERFSGFKKIAIEFHLTKAGTKPQAETINQNLIDLGFEPYHRLLDTKKLNWTQLCFYRKGEE